MDHIQFIKSLDPVDKQALHARSNRKGLIHLAGHFGVLALMAIYIAGQGPLWPLLMVPYGIAIVFLFTLSHECTHATPFAHPKISDIVGHLVALPLLLPFTWFRYFHLAHHKHTNDPDRDPELAGGGRPTTRRDLALYLSGWGYWSGNALTIWRNAWYKIDAPYLPPRKHGAIRREARVLLALYTLIALSLLFSPLALWLWLVPALIGQPFLRVYLLAEHGLCPPVADMLENTRTTFTNRVIRAVAWNMPYHAEHHAMPMVPFHALPALHTKVRSHLKSTSESYTAFSRDYVRSLEEQTEAKHG
ncbi:Fatty acid desaturase subfamily [Sulfitobacter noctilucicola]|uniref:Fatty acid desaturase n=1 Tax=Sulfitobacter noctilucicola TaxID=1342301 RepID=A0A7W6M9M0_9RHOB|nr:fatty acid desaturase [Sulfitobacter noctilucicola]KIN64850.1 Fatty acid desaturase subfamily [Sulfitobacter noctilucicola]MBB4174006.1 fatty acid desaturase [Sulfitobacter noctilucicola]